MATSPSHGNSSCEVSSDKALTRLKELSNSAIVKTLNSALGPKADLHLVGGTVREACLAQRSDSGIPSDLDFASRFTPEQSLELLNTAGIRVIETGLQHGTITAVIDAHNIEITTFRIPSKHGNNQYATTIEEDLGGRDFTINAIAFSLASQSLIDTFQGLNDLTQHILRAVADPFARFSEDPLRILRMLRFGPAQNREIIPETLAAAKELRTLLNSVSAERIRCELVKILISPAPARALRVMRDLELLEFVIPELIPSVHFEQNEFHSQDVFEHTLTVIENCAANERLRLTALFHDAGKPATLSVDENGKRHFFKHENISEELCISAMHRLRFSNEISAQVAKLVRYHMRPLECGPSAVRRLVRDLGPLLDDWKQFKRADYSTVLDLPSVNAELAKFEEMLETERQRSKGSPFAKLAINGDDLKTLGLNEGKQLGSILKALEEMVLENPDLNDRDSLLIEAKKLIALS